MKNKDLMGHVAALCTIVVWGTTFISTKVLLQTFSPVEILLIRFIIGYLALWCVCPRRLPVKEKSQEFFFMAAGLCGVALYYLLENIALTYTSASNVGVIISIAPFFTAIFTRLLLREGRAGIRFYIGFAIAMLGVVLISFGKGGALQLNPLGDFLAVAAAVVWAVYAVITRKISGFGYSTVQTTRRTFFYGLLFMLPVLFLADFQVELSQFYQIETAGNLLFLGLGASALCFVTWNVAVKRLGPVKTSIYIYMVPVITAVTAALVLREQMTPAVLGGIGLTLTGLFLSEQKTSKKRTERHGHMERREFQE